jgi:tetratricopeptide (TPR) repeat protein
MTLFGRKKDGKFDAAARLLADGDVEGAIRDLHKILQTQPEHVNAMVTLAVALFEIQKPLERESPETLEALGLLDQASALNPNSVVPLFNRGVCQRKLGLKEDAIKSFEAVLEIETRHTLSLLHLAEINYELEHWEEALKWARLALIRDPGIEGALSWVKDAKEKAILVGVEVNVAGDKLPDHEDPEPL